MGDKFNVGERVAFNHPTDSWILGKVKSIDGDPSKTKCKYTCVSDEGQETTFNTSLGKLYHARDEIFNEEPDDLLLLTELHESTLLCCLKKRFLRDVVYTNIGSLVVAVNPFKRIPHYQPEVSMQQYLSQGPVVQGQLPHVWSCAHQTYYELRNDRQNQTVLVSGESGAGKTVAAKIVVEYLTTISCQTSTNDVKHATQQVGVKVQAASPILESFGNAKTVRNDNSSRFGKFMKAQFSTDGVLVGAHTTKYLLEKSRILSAAKEERVYHVFYQICAHASRDKYGLKEASEYVSCTSGECLQIPGVDDAEDQSACIEAMNAIGMTSEEQNSVWNTVAGILNFQNINISEKMDSQNNPKSFLDQTAKAQLVEACSLFGVNATEMEIELTSTTSSMKGETVTKQLSQKKSLDTRDSVSKVLYDNMFQWLVEKINTTTDKTAETANWLGLLDIFGFEHFPKNGFEQLCINLANEALQNHYNRFIFVEDMKECEREGIDTTGVDFADNDACLDLLYGKTSIFSMLDEECKLGQGTDDTLVAKLHSKFGPEGQGKGAKSGHLFYGRPVTDPKSFFIRHYAADVTYDVTGFLEKNKEPLKDELRKICRASTDSFIAKLIPEAQDSGRPSAQVTVSGFFKKQVIELVDLIQSTNPHWIRCIKAHPAKKPLLWSPTDVMNQLRSAGVIETVRVRKAGYPIRFTHQLFKERYRALLGSEGLNDASNQIGDKTMCQKVFDSQGIDPSIGQMGVTKVFLRQQAFISLNAAKDAVQATAIKKIQQAGKALKVRYQCFLLFVEKHKERLAQESQEKLEAEKRERLLQQEQLAQEAEARREEERKMEGLRNSAATSIQKLVRGMLSRTKTLQEWIEIERSKEEIKIDDQLYDMHEMMFQLDQHRLKMEDLETRRVQKRLRQQRRARAVDTARNMTQSKLHEAEQQREKDIEREFKQEELLRVQSQNRERREAYTKKMEALRQLREEERIKNEAKLKKRKERERQLRQSAATREDEAQRKFLRSIEKREQKKTIDGEQRTHHFKLACQQFEARDNWESNREQILAHEYSHRARHSRVAANKQILNDFDLYQNPPNLLFAPSVIGETGAPSTLTRQQCLLEREYQQRISEEYSFLNRVGKDPIEALQHQREKALLEIRQKRKLERKKEKEKILAGLT